MDKVLIRCGTCMFWGNYAEERNGELRANCEVDRARHQKVYTTKAVDCCQYWKPRDFPPVELMLFNILKNMSEMRTQLGRLLIQEDKNASKVGTVSEGRDWNGQVRAECVEDMTEQAGDERPNSPVGEEEKEAPKKKRGRPPKKKN